MTRLLLIGLVTGCVIGEPPLVDRDGGQDVTLDAPFDAGFACTPDAPGCFGDVHYRCGPDGRSRLDEVTCPEACDPQRGCVTCVPGSRRCDGTVSEICDEDGAGYRFGRDCADWEVACGDDGYCMDACAEAEATRSYVGCEYFASPLANFPGTPGPILFDFRVVVTNPSPRVTDVTVSRGSVIVARETLVPGAVVDITLPWIDGTSFPFDGGTYEANVVADAGYRIRSSAPVIAAQFNPFHYVEGRNFSYSNDASLLLPVHALGTDYVALTYAPLSASAGEAGNWWPSYVALVGVTPEPSHVRIVPTVPLAPDAGGRWGAVAAGEPLDLVLARGEVAQVVPAVPPVCTPDRPTAAPIVGVDGALVCLEHEHDPTGSRITSDRPIAVFGGHTCAYLPYTVPACDHLEESLAPVVTWGTEFETVVLGDPDERTSNLLRIVAAHDGTEVTLTPPPTGLDAVQRLDAGEYVDLTIDAPIALDATRPIEVAQYLLGQNLTDPPRPRGDPALTTLVPHEQFRSSYVFVTPTSYAPIVDGQSWIVVSRPPGVPITLDGRTVEATWATVGDRELATIPVSGGTHRVTASATFGLTAFGLGSYTSYAYPAGLDLTIVPF